MPDFATSENNRMVPPSQPPARLLIVEDEYIVARDIRVILEKSGFDILGTPASGEAAIETCGSAHPDLVLMDIKLAGRLDGIETAARIRRQFGIPVIFLTAFADESLLNRARQAEPCAYLLKPYNSEQLRVNVEIALYKARLDEEVRLSELRYRTMADHMHDWEFWIGPEGRYRHLSSSCRRITGYTDSEFLQEPGLLEQIVHPDDRAVLAGHLDWRSKPDGRIKKLEFRIRRKDG